MPVFTPLQLTKLVALAKKGRIAPVYLFIGKEEICKEKMRDVLSVIKETGAVIESYDLSNKEEKKEFLAQKGMQESLFGVRKVYVVYKANELPRDKASEVVKSLKGSTNLFCYFFLAEQFDEDNPIYGFALDKGAIIPFTVKRREDLLESELVLTLKKDSKVMDRQTASLFLSLVGKDFSHFKNELEKLVLFCLDKEVITAEDVWSVVVPEEESALYLLADTFFNSGPQKASKLVISLLDHKVEPPQILSYLYRYFKKMVVLKEFLKKHPELEKEEKYSFFAKRLQEVKESPVEEVPRFIAESHPYPLFNMKRHLKRVKDFNKVFEVLYQTDLALKRDFKNPIRAFNELFLNLWKAS